MDVTKIYAYVKKIIKRKKLQSQKKITKMKDLPISPVWSNADPDNKQAQHLERMCDMCVYRHMYMTIRNM